MIGYGILLWLTVFIAAFLIFPLKQSNPPFFETLITIVLCASTVAYGNLYFKKEDMTLKACLTTGVVWALINVAIDLPLFSFGPMKRPVTDYMTDIGLTYLVIPVITSVYAYRRR